MPLWYAFFSKPNSICAVYHFMKPNSICAVYHSVKNYLPQQLLWLADYSSYGIQTATQSQPGGCRTIRVRKYLQLGTVQGDCEKFSSLFVWLTIMMQVIIHQIANQRWTLIWIWKVILISRFGSVQCYAIYMNNHIFFLNSIDMCSIPGNET